MLRVPDKRRGWNKKSGITLLLITVLTFSIVSASGASPTYAAVTVENATAAKITNEVDAIKRAKELGAQLEGANSVSAKQDKSKNTWEVTYIPKAAGIDIRHGNLLLNASNGELLRFKEQMSNTQISQDPNEPPYDISKQKISFDEAVKIALAYKEEKNWSFQQEWKLDATPESEYSTREENKTFHKIRFDRSYKDIRYPGNKLIIFINRETGEIASHQIYWSKKTFTIQPDMLPHGSAANILFREIQPFLQRSENSAYTEQKPVYSMNMYYRLDFSGEMRKDLNMETPAPPKNIIPQYSKELAKKRLLSLYELELMFMDVETGEAVPVYELRIKEGVPLFYGGMHPSIDANTGEWLDFLGKPVSEPLPAASDWLIDHVAPPGNVGYKAAIVWNNELLELAHTPIINNGATLVPFRELLKKLGAQISWDPVKRKVTASKGGHTIELLIDSSTAYINGKPQSLGTPAIIKGGYTYIPARLVLETFGAEVDWNADSRLVLIKTDSTLPSLTATKISQLRFEAQLDWEEKRS